MNVILSKVARRARKALLATSAGGGCFRADVALQRLRRFQLPEADEARELLMSLSPKPAPAFGGWRYENPATLDLSVIVPCYNVEGYVGECLRSVLEQEVDFTMEVIVVNDGSTDGTLVEIRKATEGYGRVVLVDQENRGLSGARNAGIDIARGAALAFVDSDDMLAPGHLQALMDCYRESGCDYVSGLYKRMSEDGEVLGLAGAVRRHGAPWGRIYGCRVWEGLRFPVGYWFEDTVQAYCIGPRFSEAVSNDSGYLFRQRASSITHTSPSSYKSLDTFWVVEEMLDWCRRLDIPLEQRLYDQTLSQFGPLLVNRTALLDETQRLALFALCCNLLAGVPEFEGLATMKGGRWPDIEQALRTGDYGLWRAACRWAG